MITSLVKMKFGSALYGTSTPSSDLDIKAVHLPWAEDLLMQRVKPVISQHTKADHSSRNTSKDVDFESYSLQKYLALVCEGQTVALDMLFAPTWAFDGVPHLLWVEIQNNKHRLLSKQYASFLGYCRQQSNKYGVKGSRMAAARAALGFLDFALTQHGTTAKLRELGDGIVRMVGQTEHMSIVNQTMLGDVTIPHWEVCGRKMPYSSSIKSARDIMAKLFDEYGKRARMAETNSGVDWKALSHAVRIGYQAIELLSTGNVIFPRPDAPHLLEIKLGHLDYKIVAEEIEDLLDRLEHEAAKSSLPDKPDREWVDNFIMWAHHNVILNY